MDLTADGGLLKKELWARIEMKGDKSSKLNNRKKKGLKSK